MTHKIYMKFRTREEPKSIEELDEIGWQEAPAYGFKIVMPGQTYTKINPGSDTASHAPANEQVNVTLVPLDDPLPTALVRRMSHGTPYIILRNHPSLKSQDCWLIRGHAEYIAQISGHIRRIVFDAPCRFPTIWQDPDKTGDPHCIYVPLELNAEPAVMMFVSVPVELKRSQRT